MQLIRSKAKRALVVISALCVAGLVGYRWYFPYGNTHCCSAGIGIQLNNYASAHDGWLPHGESSPEASMSLLCVDSTNFLPWVRGKNVSMTIAESAWKKDGRLSPESCGWHYVEGLRSDDDSAIAVAWDKVRGLGHNGQRRAGKTREIILLDCSHTEIPEASWSQFMVDQKKKLETIITSRATNSPAIRWSDEESLGTNWFRPAK
jgi:hypothetical protein